MHARVGCIRSEGTSWPIGHPPIAATHGRGRKLKRAARWVGHAPIAAALCRASHGVPPWARRASCHRGALRMVSPDSAHFGRHVSQRARWPLRDTPQRRSVASGRPVGRLGERRPRLQLREAGSELRHQGRGRLFLRDLILEAGVLLLNVLFHLLKPILLLFALGFGSLERLL